MGSLSRARRCRRGRRESEFARCREEASRFSDEAVRRSGLEQERIDAETIGAFRRVGRGHDENRHARCQRVALQNIAQRVAVDERQRQFGDDQRRRSGKDLRQRVTAIDSLDDGTAGAREFLAVHSSSLGVGLGDQHHRRRERRSNPILAFSVALGLHEKKIAPNHDRGLSDFYRTSVRFLRM